MPMSEINDYVFNGEGSEPSIDNSEAAQNSTESIAEFVFGDEASISSDLMIPAPGTSNIGKILRATGAYTADWQDVVATTIEWGNITGALADQSDLQAALDAKVDKVTGYGLSKNDLSDALKATYDGYASGKEDTGVAAGLMSSHLSTYAHGDIAHSNRVTLDLISEAFTTALKSTYDGYASGKEAALGNPSVSGYVLSSTDAGVRSWVAQSAGVTAHSALSQLDYASAGHTGFEPTVTKGNLAESTSSVLTITGGTNAVIGSGTTIQVKAAGAAQAGYLSSTDWNTFNDKQAALGYTPENTANLRTSFQVTPDDTHYASEKLIKDSLDAKQTAHANLTSLAALSYVSVSFVKMTAANTFALDTVVLGSAAQANTGDFDAAGAAASVAGDLSTHASLTGSNVHGLGTASTYAYTAFQAANANLTSLAALSYVSLSFVKMSAAGTFSLDTNTYYKSGDTATFANITDNGLTASKVVFTNGSKVLTSTGIGTSAQFIMGDGSLNSDVYLDETVQINAQTGTTYALQASDNGKLVTLNNASAITLTVPSGLGAGFSCQILQLGAGQVTVSPSSTTVNNANSHTKLTGQYSSASLVAYAADTFLFQGDTTT